MQKTLLLIKPNATKKKVSGRILSVIEENGFEILNLKVLCMDKDIASRFYSVHLGKDFYDRLIEFMTSGKTIAVELQKENAVEDLRTLVGHTNPFKANIGTIRYLFGDSLTENAVHASDSEVNGKKEIEIIFNK